MLAFSADGKDSKPFLSCKLSRYLKIMTYLSILPICSRTEFNVNLNEFQVIAEVKKWRAVIVVLTDWLNTLGIQIFITFFCFKTVFCWLVNIL